MQAELIQFRKQRPAKNPSEIVVPLRFTRAVAEAWITELRSYLRQGIQLHWYDDRYRTVPHELRSARILDDHPALAGHKRTIGALKAALASTV